MIDSQIRAAIYSQGWHQREFQAGVSDCCQFVRAVILHVYGRDVMESFPVYHDWQLALRGRTLFATVCDLIGNPALDHAPGRPALLHLAGREVMGITMSDQSAVAFPGFLYAANLRSVRHEWAV